MAVRRSAPSDATVWDPVAAIYMYTRYDANIDTNLMVANNILQGS